MSARILVRGVGGLVAGAAAWCTLGVAALEVSSSSTGVVGLLPPLWVLALSAALGLVAAGTRRIPTTSLFVPCLTLVPWVAPPVPPLLVWLGPFSVMLWVIAAILAIANWPRPRAAGPAVSGSGGLAAPTDEEASGGLASSLVAGAAVAMIVTAIQLAGDPRRVTGDEPHYLIVASSLLQDGDIELTNDYDEARHQSFYPGSLEPRHTVLTKAGREYSFHGLGTSLLVVPGFAAAGAIGARAVVLLVTSLAVGGLWAALRRASQSRAGAWAGVAGLVLQIPFAAQASAIYPDGLAASVACVGLWLLIGLERGGGATGLALAGVGGALATLPWLHLRLAVVAALFATALALVLWRRDFGARAFGALFAAPLVSAAIWFGSFVTLFETFDPTEPFRQKAGGSLAALPAGLLGLLIDQEYGLLPYAPAMVFAIAGVAAAMRRYPVTAWCAATMWVTTLALGGSFVWFGGTSSPARFLVPVLPLAAFFVAMWWPNARASLRWAYVFSVALGGTLLGLGAVADRGVRLVGDPDGRFTIFEWMSAVVDVPGALPSLFRAGTALGGEAVLAGLWAVLALLILVGTLWLARALRVRAMTSSIVAWGLVAWIAGGLGAAWSMRGVLPLTSDRSQAHLLRESFRSPWLRTAWSREGPTDRNRLLSRMAFAMRGSDASELLSVAEVPPGRYRIEASGVSSRSPVRLELGRDAWPSWSWDAAGPGAAPEFVLVTPVHSLRVVGESPLPPALEVRVVADARARPIATDETASRVTRYGRWLVYSLDSGSHMETGGFWAAADRATRLVISDVGGTSPAFALSLEAGPAGVVIQVRGPFGAEDRVIAAGARTRVDVPAAASPAPIEIAVQGGFEAGAAFANRADRRRLGVWVAVEDP